MIKAFTLSAIAALSWAFAAVAESGEQYPENRVHRAVYGYEFGASKETGLREREFPFETPRPLGTVMFAFGDLFTVSAQTTNGSWQVLQHLDAQGEMTDDVFKGKNMSFWYAPKDFVASAVKVSVEIPANAAPKYDGTYTAEVGGLHIWSNRWFNISAYATAFASSSPRKTGKINDECIRGAWDCWGNEPNGKKVSPENPSYVGLAWLKPVKISSLALSYCFFATAEVQVFVGKGHPKDGTKKDWKTVTTMTECRTWYPPRSNVLFVDFPKPIKTRGVRLLITEASNARLDGHPHMAKRSKDGTYVELNELMALTDEKSAKAARKVYLESQPKELGIPITFDMPFDGVATLVLEDEKGKRVRNLVSAQTFKKGKNTVLWDGSDDLGRDVDAARHGLYRIPYRPVEPGTYRVKGIAHAPLKTIYEFPVYTAGNPPWCLPDHTGGWLSNHGAPRAAVSLPPDRVAFGANITEGVDGIAIADLNGRKVGGRGWVGGNWTAAAFLAADVGPEADGDYDYYVGGLYGGNQKSGDPRALRLTAIKKNNQEQRFGGWPLSFDYGYDDQVGGLAVWNGTLTFSLTLENRVVATNPVTHVSKEISVPSPRGIAYAPDGSLLVISSNELLRVAADFSGVKARLFKGLDTPFGLATKGNVAVVSCRGQSHQLWVFTLSNQKARLVRKIGNPGRPKSGIFDPNHMNNPAGLCIDAKGRVWSTEQDFLPKRVACWDLMTGELVKDICGPAKYGAGGMFDPRDPTLFYYEEAGGLMEFKVDWKTGTSRLNRVLLRPEERGGDDSAAPERVIYAPNGRRLYTNTWNANPVNGWASKLWAEEDNHLVPVTGYGTGTDGGGGVMFTDNGDVLVQKLKHPRGEKDPPWIVSRPADAARFKPVEYKNGLPVYDFTKPERIFENARLSESTGGSQMVIDKKGNAFVTAPAGDSPSHTFCGGRDGVVTWTYPNMWPGLHAGHEAPRSAPKGRLTAPTRMLGDCVQVSGTDESIVAINGNHGEVYLFTTDGFFLDHILENCLTGRRWAFGLLPRGSDLTGVSPGDEHFWPTINRLPDGKIYFVVGKDASCVVRVDGLETMRRFNGDSITVTTKMLQDLREEQEKEARRQLMTKGIGSLVCRLVDNKTSKKEGTARSAVPTVDGNLEEDWDKDDFVSIENAGAFAYFDSNSRPYDIRGALKASPSNLYVAWKCEGTRELARNSGEYSELLFKTGGGVDIMLRTNPKAKGLDPQPGDLRILAAMVKKVENKRETYVPRVMLYEQKTAKPSTARVPFTSPVMSVTFDRVEDITDKCEFAEGKKGDYELKVPLEVIGFTPKIGTKTIGDIGVLRGADGATVARLYWANKATGIVSDVPSEVMLSPRNWGPVKLSR